jgi:hypothetical protein
MLKVKLPIRSIRSIRSSYIACSSQSLSLNNINDYDNKYNNSRYVRHFSSSSPPSSPPSSSSQPSSSSSSNGNGGIFGLDSNVASENFKGRWLMAVPAFLTHMCIGSPWAWSLMADVVTREVG